MVEGVAPAGTARGGRTGLAARLARTPRSAPAYLALAPLLWLLFGLILYPTFNTIELSFTKDDRLSLDYYAEFFTYGPTLRAFRNTIVLGFSTVIVCGLIGTGLALLTNRLSFRGRLFLDVVLLIPVMIPGVALTIAYMQLYGESGMVTKSVQRLFGMAEPPFVLSGFWGILVIHAYTQYVFFYVNVSAALKRVDRSVVEAARTFGASRFHILRTVILPLLIPAFVAAGVLTFMSGIGSFAAPSLLGGTYRVLSVQILMSKVNDYVEFAAVQGIMLSVISVAFLALMRFAETRRDYVSAKSGPPLRPRPLTGLGTLIAFYAAMALLVLFVALPILTIFALSFVEPGTWMVEIFPHSFGWENYATFLSRPRTYDPFVNSLVMAGGATAVALVAGAVASYVIVKTRLRIRWLIEVTVLLPWALPASTVAINMIAAFNEPNPVTGGVILVGTYWLLPLTYVTGILVLVVRSTNAALMGLHDSLEEASRSLGAGWLTTFRRVTLPIVAPGILAGGLLGFVISLDEYTASALMYTVHNLPISVATRNAMFDFKIGLAMTYATLQILLTLAIIWGVKRFSAMAEFRF